MTLTHDGWECPDQPLLARHLNSVYPFSEYGPADGDPVTRAAHDVAAALNGKVTFIRPVPDAPPGTVY